MSTTPTTFRDLEPSAFNHRYNFHSLCSPSSHHYRAAAQHESAGALRGIPLGTCMSHQGIKMSLDAEC